MADQEAFNKLNELLKTVANPKLRASLLAQSNILAEEQGLEKKRFVPLPWGKAYLVTISAGKESREEYDSPAALLRYLGISKSGAETMVQAFERFGYKVSSDGAPEKGLPFLVRQVGRLTPMRPRGGTYRIEKPEVTITPRRAGAPRVEEREPYIVVKDYSGKIIRWEDASGSILPRELWPPTQLEQFETRPAFLTQEDMPMPPNLGPPLPRSMQIYWPWVTPPTHGWRRSSLDPLWYYRD